LTPGSARPFPPEKDAEWVRDLSAPCPVSGDGWTQRKLSRDADLRAPAKLSHVYERVSDDAPWPNKSAVLPAYEQVFQGF
jgi:hypothetical protein